MFRARGDVFGDLLDLVQEPFGPRVQGRARLGEAKRARSALDETHAKFVFERADVRRYRRLRRAGRSARATAVAVPGDAIEAGERCEIHHRSIFDPDRSIFAACRAGAKRQLPRAPDRPTLTDLGSAEEFGASCVLRSERDLVLGEPDLRAIATEEYAEARRDLEPGGFNEGMSS